MAKLPLLSDLGDLKNKKVLLRTDLNVPLQDGKITDEHRIQASVKTIQELKNQGAVVSVCSHLGRPKGKPDSKLSLDPVAKRLQELVGEIEVMENLRFRFEEEAEPNEKNQDAIEAFVKELISGKDYFVNDAFGASHRNHASIVGPPKHLPSAAGFLLQAEVEVLENMLEAKRKPFVVIMGGAKVSDKLKVIESLLEKADILLIGGAMAFSFLVAKGADINSPLVEVDEIPKLASLLNSEMGEKIKLPEDLTALNPEGEVVQIGINLPPAWEARDIGPGTAASYVDFIETAGSIFWNGPVGVFEDERFMAGTKTIAEAIANSKAYTIVGGGDSAFAVRTLGLEKRVDHLSTGGGATLEFLEAGSLIGIDALK